MKPRPVANFSTRFGLFLLVAASAPILPGFASLGSATNYAVQSQPTAMAVADLNGDTFRDLAVANASGSVSILLGTAAGGFGAATHFPIATGAGRIPSSVAIQDLNGDTFPDLVVGTGGIGLSSTVQVFLGNGAGSFGTPTTSSAGGNDPWSVVTGDFTGDGKVDIATANRNNDTVSVLPGNGDGTFGAAATYPVGTFPTTIAAGDLNGDSRPDLVTTNANSDNISVLLADGSGSFLAKVDYATGFYPFGVAIGDLNGDGKPDLATSDNISDGVFVLLNNGPGTFGTASFFATGDGATAVAIGDLNEDNRPDLAVANYFGNTVTVLTGNGLGNFGSPVNYAGSTPSYVVIGRFGSDARPDLAFTNDGSDAVSVLLNTTVPSPARLGTVKVTGPSTLTAGRVATYKVTIPNAGKAAATGVTLKVSGPGIRFKSTVGTIAAGTTKTVIVKVRPNRTGRIAVTFAVTSTNAGSKTVRR